MTENSDIPFSTLGAVRDVDPQPIGIRWLVRPDGSKVLQFAQSWRRGWGEVSFEWVDVPEVKE